MIESDLKIAMRMGSISPSLTRDPKDLGRFGLGLKTASFSQCKKLTVASKTIDNDIVIRCWDIDYIKNTNDWRLLKIKFDKNNIHFSSLAEMQCGTVVLWESMDAICKNCNVNDQKAQRLFYDRIDIVKKHLAMTFHRFLERHLLKIYINTNCIEPWDPFLRYEKATQILTEESHSIFGNKIKIIPYVLPHHSKIDKDTYVYAEGPKGWTAQQGFYVYRNERLIVAGSWLGLGFKKFEHYQLARIQIDIPNSMDSDWEIDVKKSIARPPDYLRDDLKRIARLTIDHAMEIYRYRGKVLQRNNSSEYVFLWEKKVKHGKIFYSINRQHPLIVDLSNNLGNNTSQFKVLLKLIEETVPVNLILIDNAEGPDKHGKPFETTPQNELKEVALAIYQSLIKSGLTPLEAKNKIITMEPFDNYSEFILNLIEN